LADKGAVLVGDWDTPAKWKKVTRAEVAPPVANINNSTADEIGNTQMFYNVQGLGTVSRQDYFPDADSFYEHAGQRQLVFVDATTDAGKASLGLGEKRKKRIAFARLDIHFYGPPTYYAYPLPNGITDINSVLTVDRYQYLV
jgi:hypothetical protein